MANVKYTETMINFIIDKTKLGYSQTEIAKALGVSQTGVSKIIRQHGVKKSKLTLS